MVYGDRVAWNVLVQSAVCAALLPYACALMCVCNYCPRSRCTVSDNGFCQVIRTHHGKSLDITTRQCISSNASRLICPSKRNGLLNSHPCPRARCCNSDLCNKEDGNLQSLCSSKIDDMVHTGNRPPSSIDDFSRRQHDNGSDIGTDITDDGDIGGNVNSGEDETPLQLSPNQTRKTFDELKTKDTLVVGKTVPPYVDGQARHQQHSSEAPTPVPRHQSKHHHDSRSERKSSKKRHWRMETSLAEIEDQSEIKTLPTYHQTREKRKVELTTNRNLKLIARSRKRHQIKDTEFRTNAAHERQPSTSARRDDLKHEPLPLRTALHDKTILRTTSLRAFTLAATDCTDTVKHRVFYSVEMAVPSLALALVSIWVSVVILSTLTLCRLKASLSPGRVVKL